MKKERLDQLPMRAIDFANEADKAAYDQIVSLVDSMLALHKRLAAAKSEAQKTVIQRQIDATDAEIDRLVYDLYGLTADEVAIVERQNERR
ncbi:MAG: hypothetical protein WCB27_09225 [Thermoguttaceae bacterium]